MQSVTWSRRIVRRSFCSRSSRSKRCVCFLHNYWHGRGNSGAPGSFFLFFFHSALHFCWTTTKTRQSASALMPRQSFLLAHWMIWLAGEVFPLPTSDGFGTLWQAGWEFGKPRRVGSGSGNKPGVHFLVGGRIAVAVHGHGFKAPGRCRQPTPDHTQDESLSWL